jgi:D-arabinose 1-dehydrogenase-like Zn-dependent alcohol dehydrogenase
MTTTMQAARVPSSGDARLEITELALPVPAPEWVRVRIEACGICHSDSITVQNLWPIEYPRVPGHEIAGTIDVIGDAVVGWNAGDRVGIGWHGGHCGYCDRCRRGDFNTCRNLQIPGIAYDGGYAEYAVVKANALARIPAGLKSEEAAPLMCAGVTTFNSLRHSGARPGDLVAILGVGGLGHLGVQYAAKMGFETVAIARGRDKEELAVKLGARHYLDGESVDVGDALQKLGGARVVLSTVTEAKAMEPVIAGLTVNGELLILGASPTPLSLNTMPMIGARQSVTAWPSGTCADSEDAMNFSMLMGVRAMIETLPLARAQEGYERMMSGKARFRMVLATTPTANSK